MGAGADGRTGFAPWRAEIQSEGGPFRLCAGGGGFFRALREASRGAPQWTPDTYGRLLEPKAAVAHRSSRPRVRSALACVSYRGGGRRRTSLAPDFGPLPKETLRRPGVTHTHTQNTCAKTSGTNALQAAGLIPVAFVSVWGGGGGGWHAFGLAKGGHLYPPETAVRKVAPKSVQNGGPTIDNLWRNSARKKRQLAQTWPKFDGSGPTSTDKGRN